MNTINRDQVGIKQPKIQVFNDQSTQRAKVKRKIKNYGRSSQNLLEDFDAKGSDNFHVLF